MSRIVHSRLHKLVEGVLTGDALSADTKFAEDTIKVMQAAPSYVIQKDAIDLLTRSDVASTIMAMQAADMCRLPHKEVLIEFQHHDKLHEFVMLIERENHVYGIYSFIELESGIGGVITSGARITNKQDGFICDTEADLPEEMKATMVNATVLAVAICYVLLNMKGIEREVQVHDKLNKHRVRSGKPAISQYSYVHIGKVYRSDGTSEKYTEGRHMPMHVRSGHVRNQAFGKGREEHKLVYIQPCIVNFDPGGEIKHKIKIVRA